MKEIQKKHKLSIITVCWNDKNGLDKTIKSVISQNTREFQFLIIDGASTDGTIDILEQYKDSIDYYISEPDKGIYNAMNKGVLAANGEYCLFLNAGDIFFDEKVVTRFLQENISEDIVSGKEACSFDGKKFVAYRKPPKEISLLYFMKQTLAHQSTFIRKELLLAFPYDETYKIASDYIFFFKSFFEENASYRRLDFFVSIFIMDGISSINGDLSQKERERFFTSFFPAPVLKELTINAKYSDFYIQICRNTFAGKFFRLILKFLKTIEIIRDKITIRKINSIASKK